jgi:hypothetical protein
VKRNYLIACAVVAAVGLATVVASIAVAQPSKDSKNQGQPEMKLPPGWTAADMQACIVAGTPGEMHQHLAKGVGEWQCKTTMWMAPDTQSMNSEGKLTVTPVMDGRYTRCEIVGDMPGMGPYHSSGFYGFDNVSQQFVSTFIDNHSTGIMTGTGHLSPDGKVLTWNFMYNCPITKKPAVIREVETITGPNTKTLEMFGKDPKSGREFKMMSIALTRK